MLGILKLKLLLLAGLIAFPPVAVWAYRRSDPPPSSLPTHPSSMAFSIAAADSTVRIPVEVIADGVAPQWVYVQIENQAVPEPGMISLLGLATLLFVFKRQRG